MCQVHKWKNMETIKKGTIMLFKILQDVTPADWPCRKFSANSHWSDHRHLYVCRQLLWSGESDEPWSYQYILSEYENCFCSRMTHCSSDWSAIWWMTESINDSVLFALCISDPKIHCNHVSFQAGLRCNKAIGEWSIKSYVRENRWPVQSFYSPLAYFDENENEKQKVEVIQ